MSGGGPLSPGTRRRLLHGLAGLLPPPIPSGVAIYISSAISGECVAGLRQEGSGDQVGGHRRWNGAAGELQ